MDMASLGLGLMITIVVVIILWTCYCGITRRN